MTKQQHIQKYLIKVQSATLAEIYDHVPFGYYANGHKHLGEVLSRMVKNGMIERVQKGVFRSRINVEQIGLFKGEL